MTALREWLRDTGMSQSDLARELGVTRQAVSAWLRGKSKPGLGKLLALDDLSGGRLGPRNFIG